MMHVSLKDKEGTKVACVVFTRNSKRFSFEAFYLLHLISLVLGCMMELLCVFLCRLHHSVVKIAVFWRVHCTCTRQGRNTGPADLCEVVESSIFCFQGCYLLLKLLHLSLRLDMHKRSEVTHQNQTVSIKSSFDKTSHSCFNSLAIIVSISCVCMLHRRECVRLT